MQFISPLEEKTASTGSLELHFKSERNEDGEDFCFDHHSFDSMLGSSAHNFLCCWTLQRWRFLSKKLVIEGFSCFCDPNSSTQLSNQSGHLRLSHQGRSEHNQGNPWTETAREPKCKWWSTYISHLNKSSNDSTGIPMKWNLLSHRTTNFATIHFQFQSVSQFPFQASKLWSSIRSCS